MIEPVVAIIVIVAFGVLAYRARYRTKDALHRQFETWRASEAAGMLRGLDLRVVKYVCQETGGDTASRGARTGWWYCVAPGPRWLLVIGQDVPVNLVGTKLTWVVRELSEERMRGALAGDERAMGLAFGSAFEG